MAVTSAPPRRLRHHLVAMVALERAIEQRTVPVLADEVQHREVLDAARALAAHSADQRKALEARARIVASDLEVPDLATVGAPLEAVQNATMYPASSALIALHTLAGQAVTGYAMLVELAFRAADSSELLGPDNTGDIAAAGMRMYAATANDLIRLLPFVVADELDEEGAECRCVCATCSVGVCGCTLAVRRRLGMAWHDAGPVERTPGIRLATPRTGSPAAAAGLERADEITAVEGHRLESQPVVDTLPLLQAAISGVPVGDHVHVEARRPSGERVALTLERPVPPAAVP